MQCFIALKLIAEIIQHRIAFGIVELKSNQRLRVGHHLFGEFGLGIGVGGESHNGK